MDFSTESTKGVVGKNLQETPMVHGKILGFLGLGIRAQLGWSQCHLAVHRRSA